MMNPGGLDTITLLLKIPLLLEHQDVHHHRFQLHRCHQQVFKQAIHTCRKHLHLSSASFQMGNYPYLQEAAPTMSSASFQMASYPYLLEAATKSHKPASSLTYPMLAPSFVSSPTVSFVPPLSTFPSVSSTSTPAIVSTNQSFLAAELPPLFAAPTSTLPFITVSSLPLTTPSLSGPLPIGFDQNRTYLLLQSTH